MLAREGAMDHARNLAFHADYRAGTLDIDAFLRFQLEPLSREPMERLLAWRERYVAELVRPRLRPQGRALLRDHESRGHEIVLVTATNRFLVEPIARALGIPHLLCTRPETSDGRFTGRVDGVPCFREGKVAHLEEWLRTRGLRRSEVEGSWFYTDSRNDLPLLSAVDHPVAVDPDPGLRARAEREGWPILRWRQSDMPYSSPPIG